MRRPIRAASWELARAGGGGGAAGRLRGEPGPGRGRAGSPGPGVEGRRAPGPPGLRGLTRGISAAEACGRRPGRQAGLTGLIAKTLGGLPGYCLLGSFLEKGGSLAREGAGGWWQRSFYPRKSLPTVCHRAREQ